MIPGFSGKRGIAFPKLVLWLFVLGNVAAVLRVVPTFFPDSNVLQMLWAGSGVFAWVAVLLLAVQVWGTWGRN
jgi:hypothetical protein